MNSPENLNHTKWACKYHIAWIPKYRKKSIYKELRQYLGSLLPDLALQKECKIEEGHLMSDHVHNLISIPPKYSVAQVVGFINSCYASSDKSPSCRAEHWRFYREQPEGVRQGCRALPKGQEVPKGNPR
jgi:REP element-mobilizing transposase RayT